MLKLIYQSYIPDDVFKQSQNDDGSNLKVNIFEKTRSRSRSSLNARTMSFFSSNQNMLRSDIVNRYEKYDRFSVLCSIFNAF